MKLSVGTPVVTRLPATSAPWEQSGSIEDVARIAVTADRLGYDHPLEIAKRRGTLDVVGGGHRGRPRRAAPLALTGLAAAKPADRQETGR